MSMLLKFFGPGVAACAAERFAVRLYAPESFTSSGGYGLPKLYGGVIAVNVVYSTFTMLSLGFRVGKARREAIEKAKKDGNDPDAEARYSLPKMQAEGFSEDAKKFNCIQRGHQQALETYGSFLALSLIGGLAQPIVTIVSGLLWSYSRIRWADGYSTGDPMARYEKSGGWGRHVWTALGNLMVASTCTALVVGGIL
uniref:Glutathione transferase n=1 Tax=Odontella aurita TaxID=265563 RepID=A0A7S4JHF1_9STRA|mmetsp:Transcript_46581/g.141098  ORF Transcript_46581/g.141098 Transcript_46581/m.141098 type:complete len:197 (+) Transcript_46581:250-840(+)|eukprot:CAMPEP_0113534756 /NCGR_PEP_ID=MMETSP0015_2-20120614/5330_1 /TAXON_ID=2838 /ORGANISM="Odontella" /LENGTH=196 /DNA_ID=CAMNT_0000433941 /DNA_START=117 /DNA_END=707 /DNA_ORIENTATION=+ /assembly_acc=CAM_ASM_000160